MTPDPRYAVDTSVAVALVMKNHGRHPAVSRWAQGKDLILSGHAAVETYSVLTRLPGDARLTAEDAIAVMDDRFSGVVALSAADSAAAHHQLASVGVVGGAVYDGLVALAAKAAGLRLATGDARAFSTYDAVGAEAVLVR